MLSLVLGAICFSGIHLGIAGTPFRDRAIAALGEGAYRAVFSIVSLIAILWLVMAYKDTPYVATWGILEWWKPIAIILMLPAFLLTVIGLTTPNPTSVGQEGRAARSPEGIVRVTRHPFLIGVGLWAVVHLIANGDVASFIYFGALGITALAGTVSIDAKRRRALGPGWQSFAAQTSIVPFAAIAAGRPDVGWPRSHHRRFPVSGVTGSSWRRLMLADSAEHPEPSETTPVLAAPTRTRAVMQHAGGAATLGALAMGAMALGAMAVGTVAVGRLAIGSLALKRGRARDLHIGRLQIDELMIGRIVRHDDNGRRRG
jgi:uncharacterized membrane protein